MERISKYAEPRRGEHRVYRFGNGRGASVIRGPFSYGGDEGFFEVAVLDQYGRLDYTTPVTSDVIGWLSPVGVRRVLREIEALP